MNVRRDGVVVLVVEVVGGFFKAQSVSGIEKNFSPYKYSFNPFFVWSSVFAAQFGSSGNVYRQMLQVGMVP